MSRRPFMAFYGAEFFTDTAHLTRDERDGYLRLIWAYWSRGALLDDDARLARVAQMSPNEWAAARPIIQAFFHDGWKHKRIDEELAKASAFSEKQRANVNKRWDKAAKVQKRLNKSGHTTVLPARARPTSTSTATATEVSKNSEAGASGAAAPPRPPKLQAETTPVYTDARHELWAEGPAILSGLGVPDKHARSFIGKQLRDTHDDAATVLGAINRARDARPVDPIAWITRAIPSKPKESNHGRRPQSPVRAAAERILARIEAGGRPFDLGGTGGRAGRPAELRCEAGGSPAQLLPPKRH